MQTSWDLRPEAVLAEPEKISRLSEDLGVSALTVQILLRRGLNSLEELRRFLYPKIEDLLDPFLVPGIREAVPLIQRHLARKSRILIHGDYDVDGVTSTALLSRALGRLGAETLSFLPHRLHHGYGLTKAGIDYAKENQARLIITADCGITAHQEIAEARSCGIDVIVTDHHQIPSQGIPPATVVVHSLLEESGEPFKGLSAVGLAYKLAQALLGEEAEEYLDLVALGTVADLAPLSGENRIFVKWGLEKLQDGGNRGLRVLGETAKQRGRWKASHLGFVLGPRINASGRMDSAYIALQLLTSESDREAVSLAKILEEENKRRQRLEREAVKQAVEQVERGFNFNHERVIVVWHSEWHPGVIGIVAARLVEKFYRPAVVISLDDQGFGKGSARSIRHFNIFEALNWSSHLLVEHGGHEQAAGLKIEARRLEEFRRHINEAAFRMMDPSALIKSYDVDAEISLSRLSIPLLQEFQMFEPHGVGNPKPLFLSRNVVVKRNPVVQSHDHLKLWLEDGGVILEAVWTRPQPIPWASAKRVDIIYTSDICSWQGEYFPVLELKDVKPSLA